MKYVDFDHCFGPNIIDKDSAKKIIKEFKLIQRLLNNKLKGSIIRKTINLPDIYEYWDSLLEINKKEIIEFFNKFIRILEHNFIDNEEITIWGV